jgi:hypothetical protein
LLTLQVDRRVARVLRDVGGGRLHKQNRFRQNCRVKTEKTGLFRFFSGLNRFFRVIGLVVAVEAQLVAGQVAPGLVPAGGANRFPVVVRISEIKESFCKSVRLVSRNPIVILFDVFATITKLLLNKLRTTSSLALIVRL